MSAIKYFRRECTALKGLHDCENVVDLIGVTLSPESPLPVLVLDYYQLGNLRSYIRSYRNAPFKDRILMVRKPFVYLIRA